MRRSWLAVALLSAAWSLHAAAPSEASCAAGLKFHGSPYLGYDDRGVGRGAWLAERALMPPCQDVIVNGQPPAPAPDTPVAVRAIPHVNPRIAVRRGSSVYINVATFPALPSHPLHAKYTSHPQTVKGAPCTVAGVAEVSAGLSVAGARIVVDGRSDVRLRRFGTGYVPNGAKVRVTGRACQQIAGVRWVRAARISRSTE